MTGGYIMRDFCKVPAEKTLGIYEAATHHIPHDHNYRAGEHIRQHSSHCRSLGLRGASAMGITDTHEMTAIAIMLEIHDIGKMWVNPFITAKESVFDSWETDIMRQHVYWKNVAEMMEKLGFAYPTVPDPVVDACTRHQQKTKTEGYPSDAELPFVTYDILDLVKIVDELQAGICKERKWREPKGFDAMKEELIDRGKRGILNLAIVEAIFSVPHDDIFHDQFVKPVTQMEIIHKAGAVPREIYDKLREFKFS